jgi:serine/threonine protein kinase
LIELLGRGGMAEVWKARVDGPSGFSRLVALKRPLGEFAGDPEFRKMFASEARILSQLHHPNIVGVFDFGEEHGRPFLVMELIDGWSLAKLLRVERRLPTGVTALIGRELCRGLASMHQMADESGHRLGVIHRDLSPANVMLGFDGSVRLLDFGVAKAIDAIRDERTRTGVLKGKVPYMSPEQANGKAIDHRSDQFSLGAVLFEMCTGRRLFISDADPVVLRQLREGAIDSPIEIEPSVSRALDQLCRRMLARDPEGRFADCAAVARELDGLVTKEGFGPLQLQQLLVRLREGEDATLLPPPRTNKLDHKRTRAPLLFTGAVVLLGVAGYALWQRANTTLPSPAVPSPPPIVLIAPPPVSPAPEAMVEAAPPPLRHKKTPPPSTEKRIEREIKKGKIVNPFD